jgi:hypothetical protein
METAMRNDPDIRLEARALEEAVAGDGATAAAAATDGAGPAAASAAWTPLPLNVIRQAHRASDETKALAHAAGGLTVLRDMTTRFYQKAFADATLDTFIRSHDDPHGERFAMWVAEKMGLGRPWTAERQARRVCPFHAHGNSIPGAHDRSSAHFAAWHSPKRSAEKWGDHFKLDDCRVWMRLHFWACREAGLFDNSPAFADYYVKFLGHFVSVYESQAPQFARESARWSENPENITRYLENGRTMSDVIGLSLNQALAQLPEEEKGYSGSSARTLRWPYGR